MPPSGPRRTSCPIRSSAGRPGSRVGVVGLGGLGHMAIKLAGAMGAEVTLFTTSPGKAEDARRLGAAETVVSHDLAAMARQARPLDLIIDTVSWSHDLDPFLAALFVNGRVNLAGSPIGGLGETQEMLDFCAAHGITADVERIRMDEIDTAFAGMLEGDVKYRFVIEMASLPEPAG